MVQLFRLIGFKLSFFVGLAILFSASVSMAADCSADPNECTPKKLCELSTTLDGDNIIWSTNALFSLHAQFAKSLGMNCGVVTIVDPCDSGPLGCKIDQLCEKATTNNNGQTVWNDAAVAYVEAAKDYGLACGIEIDETNALEEDTTDEAITLFGVNFDMSTDEVKETLAKRFSCKWENISRSKSKACATDGGRLLTMSFNTLGEISVFKFNCDTYKGCTFSVDEIFETLSNSITFQSEAIISDAMICSDGGLGDKVCVYRKFVHLSRNKFRVGVVSFD